MTDKPTGDVAEALDLDELTNTLLKVLNDSWSAHRDADCNAVDCTRYAVRDIVLFLETGGLLSVSKRSLTAQQPVNAELLEALNIAKQRMINCCVDIPIEVDNAIARAEQKGVGL